MISKKEKKVDRLMSLKSYASLSVLLAAVALGGCTLVGPHYHKSKNEHPDHFDRISENSKDVTHTVQETAMKDPWWEEFHDPELSLLEGRVALQNLDVLSSISELAQSRAMMVIAGAERFPNLQASGDYQRFQRSSAYVQRIIKNVGGYTEHRDSAHANAIGEQIRGMGDVVIPQLNNWQYGIDASYEVDLWGRVARQYAQAKAIRSMAEEEGRIVLISKQAEMARDYIQLRSNQRKLQVLESLVKLLKEKEELAASRYDKGLNSDQIVESVRVDRSEIEAQIPALKQDILVGMNAISMMIGEGPHTLEKELNQNIALVKPPKVASIGVPGDLVERRPDIRRAEQDLRRTLEGIAEAEAEFYPKVTINANFGLESLSIKDMGSWASRAWNIGPAIALPIFQGGRLWGQLTLAKAEQKTAAIGYHKTVLNAWQEVANALSGYGKSQERSASFDRKIHAARSNRQLVDSQHKTGLVNKMALIDAQIKEEQILLDAIQAHGDIADSLAKLYNALGGGWKEFIPDVSKSSPEGQKTHAAYKKAIKDVARSK